MALPEQSGVIVAVGDPARSLLGISALRSRLIVGSFRDTVKLPRD
ncbi:hypothetical protein [Laspinema olomoucense]|nr:MULTISPECIES: hypothetical protein [unclassified Laspinema]